MSASLQMRPQRSLRRAAAQEIALAYLLLLPALLLFLAFTFFPIAFGAYISLHNWRVGPREFVGLGNYLRALAPGSEFWPALVATLTYSLLAVPIQITLALSPAYLLFQKIRGKALFRVVMFLPWVTSTVATAAVWARLYSPDIGLINSALKALGLQPMGWLLEDRGVFGRVEAPVAGYDPVRTLMGELISKVAVKGEGDIKAELDKAVEEANKILMENAPKKGY
ncbi:MAG: sugar ABC transporter permease [Thermoflexales bacterium]|nr:sugar ABC transporter permease [Thermoflexales bacterium]